MQKSSSSEVIFTVLGVREKRSSGRASEREATFTYYETPRFPLAGPIIEAATSRELKGRCSQCGSNIRLKVKGPGAINVRCPICGHQRKIEV